MSKVFVLDTNKHPLDPVHPGWARKLLSSGQAAVYRRYPFTIILKRAVAKGPEPPLRLKLDPGSKTTGMAIVNDASGEVVFAAELSHRGQAIKKSLDSRRGVRRGRRQRKTRYRQPRFANRGNRGEGWIPPSLESWVCNVITWVKRRLRVCPLVAISQELVRFDMQLVENPEIEGVEYQQGTLQGYEVREYLLEKWERQCAYCDSKDVPLQVEHIRSRAGGGSNRLSNLTLACQPCNLKKGTQEIRDFLQDQPERLARLLAQAKASLKDASAVNVTRWVLFDQLKAFGLPVECGTGGRTKYNRATRGLEKAHWLDAACVGASTPASLHVAGVVPLLITATGHGSRQMCLMDKCVKGFQTGDIVKAIVTAGKKVGTYVGRVAVRATGSFNLTTKQGTIQGIGHRYCRSLHKCDGYSYGQGGPYRPSPKQGAPPSSPSLEGLGYPAAEVR